MTPLIRTRAGARTIPIHGARPFQFAWDLDHSALLVIDMQRDFLEAGGFGEQLGNDVSLLAAAVEPISRLLAAWRAWGLPVLHTQESHLADLSDCHPAKRYRAPSGLRIGEHGPMGRILIRGEPGTGFIDACRPVADEPVYNKPGKGAFYRTTLEHDLHARAITQLILTGVTTEVCVQSTMREANDRGFDCLLLEDCTASYFPEYKEAVLEMVRAQGALIGWTAASSLLLDAGAAFFFDG
ncbi:MAG: cysteine hydrolase [Nannocystis sp.]|nr:cysteine hydrolase [Nannocystis sp.]